MNIAGLEIEGTSVSGIGTCITLPQMGIVLDIGVCPMSATRHPTVLVTHGHVDHLGAAIQHAAVRDLMAMPKSHFIVPEAVKAPLERMFEAWAELQHEITPCQITVASPGEDVILGKNLIVRPFATDHVIPSQGYRIIERRQKLKPEYAHITGPEIGSLRKEGVTVMDTVEFLKVVYTGDTRPTVWDQPEHEDLQTAQVVITEATYLTDDASPEKAHQRGHTHILDHIARAHRFRQEAVVFTHFSARHDRHQIDQAMAGLPDKLRSRVTAL